LSPRHKACTENRAWSRHTLLRGFSYSGAGSVYYLCCQTLVLVACLSEFITHCFQIECCTYLPSLHPCMCLGAGFGVLVSGCSTVELPSKQVLPQATARARARAQDDEAAGVGARLPSSSSSSSTSQPGPKSRCLQLEQENVSRHLDDLGPTHLDLASPRSPPPRLNAALGARLPSSSSSSSTT
jgi:hypothetical protein